VLDVRCRDAVNQAQLCRHLRAVKSLLPALSTSQDGPSTCMSTTSSQHGAIPTLSDRCEALALLHSTLAAQKMPGSVSCGDVLPSRAAFTPLEMLQALWEVSAGSCQDFVRC